MSDENPGMNGNGHAKGPTMDVFDALGLPLLFHGGGKWTHEKHDQWERITGSHEVSSKVMSDHIRAVMRHWSDETIKMGVITEAEVAERLAHYK